MIYVNKSLFLINMIMDSLEINNLIHLPIISNKISEIISDTHMKRNFNF